MDPIQDFARSLKEPIVMPEWAREGLRVEGIGEFEGWEGTLKRQGAPGYWFIENQRGGFWAGSATTLGEAFRPRVETPDWVRDGVYVEGLADMLGSSGRLVGEGACWSVHDERGMFWRGEAKYVARDWRPRVEAPRSTAVVNPARPVVEVMGAVLHELRTSGDHGLHLDELLERVGPGVVEAIAVLKGEGRVVEGVRVRLSAAQRQVDDLAARLHAATTQCDASVRARADAEEVAASRLEDAEVWRSLALALTDRFLTSERREDHSSAPSDTGEFAFRRAFGRRINELARAVGQSRIGDTPEQRDAYERGLADGGWIVSYGSALPPRQLIARILLSDGTCVDGVVLRDRSVADGDDCVARSVYAVSVPFAGGTAAHLLFDADGGAVVKPPWRGAYRIRPEDLAVLRGEA